MYVRIRKFIKGYQNSYGKQHCEFAYMCMMQNLMHVHVPYMYLYIYHPSNLFYMHVDIHAHVHLPLPPSFSHLSISFILDPCDGDLLSPHDPHLQHSLACTQSSPMLSQTNNINLSVLLRSSCYYCFLERQQLFL